MHALYRQIVTEESHEQGHIQGSPVSKPLFVVEVCYFSLILRREVSAWQNVTVTNETLGEFSVVLAEPFPTP